MVPFTIRVPSPATVVTPTPSKKPMATVVNPPTKRTRRVAFALALHAVHPAAHDATPDERSRMHYTNEEIEALSREAQSHSPFWPRLQLTPDEYDAYLSSDDTHNGSTRKSRGVLALHADPSLRGLELYLYPVRVRSKLLAQKALLRYQEKLRGHPNATSVEAKAKALAAASAQLSRASRTAARETGMLDAKRAGTGGDAHKRRRWTEERREERAPKRSRKVSNV